VKHLSIPTLACLPLLCLCLSPTRAQESVGTRQRAASGSSSLGPVYSGHSSDGNLQAALDEALDEARRGVEASSPICDAVFNWELTGVHGVGGGLMGLRDLTVEITVR
jgi:hypothetical protein